MKYTLTWLIFSLLFFSSCVSKTKPKTIPISSITSKEILQSLHYYQQKVEGIKGFTKITICNNNKKQSSSASIQINKHNFLRLTFLSFFNQPIHYFILNNRKIYSYSADFSGIKKETATKEHLLKLIGVEIPPLDLSGFLMGKIPLSFFDKHYRVIISKENYLLKEIDSKKVSKDKTFWEIGCEFENLRLTSLTQFDSFGNAILKVEWKSWKKTNGVFFPMDVKIFGIKRKVSILCRYKQIKLNPYLKKSLFFPKFLHL